MSIVITGGAGFIGSNIVKMFNDKGIFDIIVVDHIGSTDKWKNIRNKKFFKYVNKNDFINEINTLNVEMIIHMGACSSTTENDFDYLIQNNLEYSKILWHYCVTQNIPFIYASSAATYGDGENGFDDCKNIDKLMPLNGYGYSKHLFDLWVNKQTAFPKQYVGLKFFNVFGPNEYHKGSMASMVYHGYHQIRKSGEIRLFKSNHPEFKDGEQLRDFIYIKDICYAIDHFISHSEINGIFNLGTGIPNSFKTLAESIFESLNMKYNIIFITMPDHLQKRYQYYTKAEVSQIEKIGYKGPKYSLREGIEDYVKNYLVLDDRIR